MSNRESLLAEGIGVPLAWRKVSRFRTDGADRLTQMGGLDNVIPGVSDVIVDHTGRVEHRMAANPAIPTILVPSEASG